MGITIPSIVFGQVMHKRLFPKVNAFTYGIYYIAVPLSELRTMPMAVNRFAPLSFYDEDHGWRDGKSPENWVKSILANYQIHEADGEIVLITMPRVLGYVFNPVSFWVCYDKADQIRAIICEVNNTFGETHSYLCVHPDRRAITRDDVMQGDKVFHVSPFLNRAGHYDFRFDITPERCGIWIDYYNAHGEKQLLTALTGKMSVMNKASMKHAFWAFPLVTFKAIALIHWQAIKLLAKGVRYVPLPLQNAEKITTTGKIKNL